MGAATSRSFLLVWWLLFFAGVVTAMSASLSALHSFGFPETAASFPHAELIQGGDGKLYGTTAAGGTVGQGTVFCVDLEGADFTVLKSFGVATNDGQRPLAALIEGGDGYLYGVTETGGQFGFGTVFKLDKGGSNFAVLLSFAGTNGAYPEARLLEGSDGSLYGTTSGGGPGTNDYGVLFRLNKNGENFELLKFFAGTDGANPVSGLIEGADGGLYGTTLFGGGTNFIPAVTSSISSNIGTVFRIEKDGSGFAVLKHFFWASVSAVQTNGYYPYGQLVQGTNGFLYGTTSAGGRELGGTVYCINTNGAEFSILRSLTNSTGNIPLGGLVLGADGRLYGATFNGGVGNSGAIFRIDQDGNNFATLASIAGGKGAAATVLQASDGRLYGTTSLGGNSHDGTIFRVQTNGVAFTILKSFSSSGGDGMSAYAGLTRGSDGMFYGNTRLGGESGAGAIFAIDPFGRNYRIVSSLTVSNGANPVATLIEGSDGTLVGTSVYGGDGSRGTLFKTSTSGESFVVVHSFGVSDGYFNAAALLESTNGYLYGVGARLGAGAGGALFQIQPDGSDYSILKQFSAGALNPMTALLHASDGKLYGTTYFSFLTQNPSSINGCIFRMNQDGGDYVVVKNFDNRLLTGANPKSALLEASDGMIYGTTYAGGSTNDAGTVFRISKDGTGFQVLRAFWGVQGDGRHPCGMIAEGSDGFIYGVTERGGLNDQGTIYRLDKSGSSYAVLASFDSSTGIYPRGGIVMGANDALFGATDQGGTGGCGTVFRFGPALEYISEVKISDGQVQLACVGEGGLDYLIERATNLVSASAWELVQTTNAPASGQFLIVDPLPPVSGAFYRMKR
jgi:uncharacterized repeat protein (TIGR03803 family)